MKLSSLIAPKGVLLLAVLLFGWNLWGYDLWAPDEPYFAEGAREMVVDGEWIVPHENGEITTHKPPLFFWLIALFSLPFGSVSAFTARLPSVLAALGSVLLLMRLGGRMSGPKTAALAGLLLVTTQIFWDKARSSQIDSLLCFLILTALFAFASFRAGEATGRGAGMVFWGAAGLAMLAKGPVGLLLPLGIALVTLAWDRDLRRWREFAPLSGPLVFVAIIASWVVPSIFWGGEYSVIGALREHFVGRAIHGMHHEQPPWYYLKVLPYALWPWTFLLPGALVLAWRRRRQPDDRFLLVATCFVIAFFTVSTEKRDLYILPAVPFFALLFARLVAAVLGWWDSKTAIQGKVPIQRWVTLPQGIVGGLMAVVGVALPFLAPRFGEPVVGPAWGLAPLLLACGLAILAAAVRGQTLQAVVRSAGAMTVLLLVVVSAVYPVINPEKSGRELAYVVRDETAATRAAGKAVLALDIAYVSRHVNFYGDGIYVQRIDGPAGLAAELAPTGDTYVLANASLLPDLPDDLRERMEIVYSTRLSRRDIVFLRFAAP